MSTTITTEFDPAALDDIDIRALRTSAALHERRNSRPGEKAAAQALLHGSARWPWTAWRDALYNSLQEAAGTMSMDTQQDDERLRTIIWAYVVHHPLAYFTQPRPVPEESYTLPALISDRMRCLHDCFEWSDVEFPMVPDGSTEERLRMAQDERINCLLTHRLPMPDLAALEDDEDSDTEDSAKKAQRRTDSQASTSPVAEPAQNSAGPTIPSLGSPSASSSAPWPASGTSGTAGSTSADAARNSLRMPPRPESADAGSSDGEAQKWCILYLGVQEWESFTGTLQEAMKEATCSNHHLNYGRTGYLILPFQSVAGSTGSSGGEGGAEEGEMDQDYVRGYDDFWKEIIEPAGVLDMDALMRELHDYRAIMGFVSKVYCQLTGGKLSKPHTDPDVVIAEVEAYFESLHEEESAAPIAAAFSAPPLRPGDIEVRMSLRTDPPPEDGEYTVLTAYGWSTMEWAAGAWQQTRDLFESDVLAWCRTGTLVNAVRSMQRSPGTIHVLMHPLKDDRCSVLIRRQPANELPPPDMDALRAAAIAHPVIFNPAAFPSSADDSCAGDY